MPHRRVPRLPSLAGRLTAALAIVVVLALAPGASLAAHAQGGPDFGAGLGFGPPGGAPGYGPAFGEVVVPGQTQICREYPGAIANFSAFYGPGYPTSSFGLPWGFPLYASYNLPPFGGFWGFYTGAGPICAWQPR